MTRLYNIQIDGETVLTDVPAHHVESAIDELSFEFDFTDEMWDDETMTVCLTTESE